MMTSKDYSKRLTNLKTRRKDQELVKKAFSEGTYQYLTESYEVLQESDTIKYVIGAMMPVSETYTQNTYEQGERVKSQLLKNLDSAYNVKFEYQGSVTNNTHIKAHSDIDILTLHGWFYTLQHPLKPVSPYKGDTVQDLLNLRQNCFKILTNAYPTAEVDDSGAKSISIKGGSLTRKIDVVPSSWYNTVLYDETKLPYYRGVSILDAKNKILIENTPFYHNKLLEVKDNLSANNYKKVVRLLKTLKADAENDIELSSYDLASLMYHMEDAKYVVGYSPLLLLENSINYLIFLNENSSYRNSLQVPDKSRNIFVQNGASKTALKLMIDELVTIYSDILDELKINGTKINKRIVA
ncbi:MAG: hypothetical protein P4L49_07730 [Desulfosporosinus sp.]|nr:hypothetical protein [Desulfosporosinus sp.]